MKAQVNFDALGGGGVKHGYPTAFYSCDRQSTLTMLSDADYVVVLPIWLQNIGSVNNAWYDFYDKIGPKGWQGEYGILDKVTDTTTFNTTYHYSTGAKSDTVTVEWTSARTITVSPQGSMGGGVLVILCKYADS